METTSNNTQIAPDIGMSAEQLEHIQNVGLNSAELANLWANYMSSSLKEYVVKYFLDKVEDKEVRSVLEYALHIARQHIQTMTDIYKRENHPIPRGFNHEDVDLNAPRLFSDPFILSYIEYMAEIRINGYATALPMSARGDIRKYFTECMASAAELYNMTSSLMLSKGVYLRAPQIPIPEKVDFVKNQSFLTGFLGDRRPLSSIEISHIFARAKANSLRKTLLTGFAQVAKSKQIGDYMIRGKDIADKHIEVMVSLLAKNGLTMPATWDSGVMQTNVAPFSERLMSQNIRTFNAMEIGNYGKALSVSLRHDVAAVITRLLAEVGKYTEDGVNILIDNGWLEEPPQAADPEALGKMH